MTATDIGIVLAGVNTLLITFTGVYAKLASVSAKRAEEKASRAVVVAAQGVAVSRSNTNKIEEVRTLTKKVQEEANGMKTELVNEVRAASFQAGVKSETDKQL